MKCPSCNGYMAYTKKGWYCRKCNSYSEQEHPYSQEIIPNVPDIDCSVNNEYFSCPQCHCRIDESEKFCHSCGFPVSEYILSVKNDRNIIAQRNIQFKMQMASLKAQQEQIALQRQQLQAQQMQYASMVKCPRCGSTSITGAKNGYGAVKGGLGALALGSVVGPVGAVVGLGAGNIGRKKINCTCINCGHRFKAGKVK